MYEIVRARHEDLGCSVRVRAERVFAPDSTPKRRRSLTTKSELVPLTNRCMVSKCIVKDCMNARGCTERLSLKGDTTRFSDPSERLIPGQQSAIRVNLTGDTLEAIATHRRLFAGVYRVPPDPQRTHIAFSAPTSSSASHRKRVER